MKNITIIGIGKLGICFGLILEKARYNVVGVDLNDNYVQSINNKTLVSSEPDVEKYLTQSKNFTATTDIQRGLNHSDVLFLFVSTPSLPNGRYDHLRVDQVVKELVRYASRSESKHLIIGCTTMPGYCDIVQDILQPYGYNVSYNPEFIAQGSIMKDLVNPDILLIGEGTQSSGDEIENINLTIVKNQPSIHRMLCKEAEITKIALNCFLTTKIAYANMVGDIAKSAECNPDIILNAIGKDSRIGNKNLKYGYGFGGPCLPRDNRAFELFAQDMNIDAIVSKSSDIANKLHLEYQLEEFMKNAERSKQIVFSGLSYKSGTTIIEESQKLALAIKLAKKGYKILIQDDQEVVKEIKSIYGDLFEYS